MDGLREQTTIFSLNRGFIDCETVGKDDLLISNEKLSYFSSSADDDAADAQHQGVL